MCGIKGNIFEHEIRYDLYSNTPVVFTLRKSYYYVCKGKLNLITRPKREMTLQRNANNSWLMKLAVLGRSLPTSIYSPQNPSCWVRLLKSPGTTGYHWQLSVSWAAQMNSGRSEHEAQQPVIKVGVTGLRWWEWCQWGLKGRGRMSGQYRDWRAGGEVSGGLNRG